MARIIYHLNIFILLLISCYCLTKRDINNNIPQEEGVYLLTEETFDDFINWNNLTFVCFHTNQEQMTKMLKEYMIVVASNLEFYEPETLVGMVNIEQSKILEARFSTKNSPPYFKLFYQARPTDYLGKLKTDTISEWIKKKTNIPSNRIKKNSQLESKIENIDYLVLYVGPISIKSFKTFLDVAKDFMQMDDIEFAHIDSYEYAKDELEQLHFQQFNDKGFGVRIYRRKNIEDIKDFEQEDFKVDSLSDFVMKSTFIGYQQNQIREMSNENAMKIFTYNKPVLILFRNTTQSESRWYEKQIQDAFEDIYYKILVATADINSAIGTKIASLVGLDVETDNFPVIRILDPNPGKSSVLKYIYTKPQITTEEIKQYVDEFISGKLQPYQQVQKNPSSRSQYVTPLNTDNFKDIVMNNSSDVFVFFTSNKCRLCEDFWPTYINTAKVLHKSQNLLFTTIDMSQNELTDQNIYYYPTVRFYPSNSKMRYYDYDQGLELQDVINFITKHATVQVIEDFSELTEKDKSQQDAVKEKEIKKEIIDDL